MSNKGRQVFPTIEKKKRNIGIILFFAQYLLIFFAAVVVYIVAYDNADAILDHPLFDFIPSLIVTLIFVMLAKSYLTEDLGRLKTFGIRAVWVILVAYVASFVVEVGYHVLLEYFGIKTLGPNQDAVEALAEQSIILSGITLVVFAPLWEEIFWRGMVFSYLRNRNRVLAYAVSSLGFALMHTWLFILFEFSPNLLPITLIYLPSGVAFCWVFEKTKSLWTAIILHAVMNGVAAVLILL